MLSSDFLLLNSFLNATFQWNYSAATIHISTAQRAIFGIIVITIFLPFNMPAPPSLMSWPKYGVGFLIQKNFSLNLPSQSYEFSDDKFYET